MIEMNFSIAISGAKGAKPPNRTMKEKIRATIPAIAPLLKAKDVLAPCFNILTPSILTIWF